MADMSNAFESLMSYITLYVFNGSWFECMSRHMALFELYAYGFDKSSLKLIYMNGKSQLIKMLIIAHGKNS